MKAGSHTRLGFLGIASLLVLVLAGAGIWMWHAATRTAPTLSSPAAGELQALGAVPDFSLIERSGRTVTLADLRNTVWVADFIYTSCTDTCPLQTAQMAKLQREFAHEPDFRLVSISVDPAHDTVAVLRQYADRFAAERERWLFLTGSPSAIHALVREGFKLDVEDVRKALEVTPALPKPGRRPPSGKSAVEVPSRQQQRHGQLRYSSVDLRCRPLRHHASAPTATDRIVSRLLFPAPALAHSGHDASAVIHSTHFVLVDRRGEIRGYYLADDEEAQGRLRTDLQTLLRQPLS